MADKTALVAQVVPDLPTFAVDDGFSYVVPADLEGVTVGSIVRVPLGSRRVRGYVVSLRRGSGEGLKPLVSVSGDLPVFDEALLQTLRWAALHYVAPLSVLLGRAAPPNLPRGKGRAPGDAVPDHVSPLPDLSLAAAEHKHSRPVCLLTAGSHAQAVADIAGGPLAAERNVAVVISTVDEAEAMAETLAARFGSRVLYVSSSLAAKDATRAWVSAERHRGYLIVGTPELALWPLGTPSLWIVVEEGRRAMKAKQTPTLQVRDLVRRRTLVERTSVAFLGALPTLDTLARGATTVEPPGRVWPLVEMVDRREDPPGGRVLADRTTMAIRQVVKTGGQVFVFVSRRGYAPAFRCVRCRELRRCPECGAGPDRGDRCRRCGRELGPCVECGGRRFEPLGAALGRVIEELRRRIGVETVGGVESARQVVVGTERDLPYIPETALSVAVDADSLLLAPHYRAEEDAVRTLVRVCATVAKGRGRRCLIQTGQPDHRALGVLRNGHPLAYLAELTQERERDGLPPATELLAVEVSGDASAQAPDMDGLAAEGIVVHGPELGAGRTRWFLQGNSLQSARILLRAVVQRWRDQGLKVRIDADPIDL